MHLRFHTYYGARICICTGQWCRHCALYQCVSARVAMSGLSTIDMPSRFGWAFPDLRLLRQYNVFDYYHKKASRLSREGGRDVWDMHGLEDASVCFASSFSG